MDLFYFYNGVKNIINLSLENELYISNSTLIYNDPLVILDFENYFQKGGGNLDEIKQKLKVAQEADAAKEQQQKEAKEQQKAAKKEAKAQQKAAAAAAKAEQKAAAAAAKADKEQQKKIGKTLGKKFTSSAIDERNKKINAEKVKKVEKERVANEKAEKKGRVANEKKDKKKLKQDKKEATSLQKQYNKTEEGKKEKAHQKAAVKKEKAEKNATEKQQKADEKAAKKEARTAADEACEDGMVSDGAGGCVKDVWDMSTKETEEINPKDTMLSGFKIIFTIVYWILIIALLPLIPFVYISYYSFKKLKDYYYENINTL